jgi:hypothetical protein
VVVSVATVARDDLVVVPAQGAEAGRGGGAVAVLHSSERSRAGMTVARTGTSGSDLTFAARLSELRAVSAVLDAARLPTGDVRALHRRRSALEAAVAGHGRATRVLRTRSTSVEVPVLLDALGSDRLVEYVRVGGQLSAVVLADGHCTLHDLAATAEVEVEIEALRFAFARLARGGPEAVMQATARAMKVAAARLNALLLVPLADRLGDSPVVVIPTGELHLLPWGLLDALAPRAFTLAPSASAWFAARERRRTQRGRIAVVAGPGLPAAREELAAVARVYGGSATVLEPEQATVEAVTEALDGAAYAHIAAHGRFRPDNARFSSLQLADGPLTTYDLERLEAAPSILVLSACDAGLSVIHPGDQVVGLVGAMLAMGTRAVIGCVAPVPDEVARDTMVAFHAGISAGFGPADALVRARRAMPEQCRDLTAGFVCFGAG